MLGSSNNEIIPFLFRLVPVPVKLSLTLESLENIEEVKMSFSVKFNLEAEWFDKRLEWMNLKKEKHLNILNNNIIDELWVPTVVFKNTENNYESTTDQKSMILVEKKGNRSLSSIHEVDETAYYKGSENPLIYSRDFYHRFQCLFDLNDYPFDTQLCTILLKKPYKVDNFVELLPKHLKYSGPKKMTEFDILKTEMKKTFKTKDFDIEVQIFLKRRVSQHLLSTFLPSFCILCIAQVWCGMSPLSTTICIFLVR